MRAERCEGAWMGERKVSGRMNEGWWGGGRHKEC